jgi:hypothetical protein
MSIFKKSLLSLGVCTSIFAVSYSFVKTGAQEEITWATSNITCNEVVCVENITFPALYISVSHDKP